MGLLVYWGMKMNEINENDLELLVKRILSEFIEDQFNDLKEEKQEDNNSFIFLEKGTLNILLNYMLMNGKNLPHEEAEQDSGNEVKISEEIEQIIVDNKKEFEEILILLKEKL